MTAQPQANPIKIAMVHPVPELTEDARCHIEYDRLGVAYEEDAYDMGMSFDHATDIGAEIEKAAKDFGLKRPVYITRNASESLRYDFGATHETLNMYYTALVMAGVFAKEGAAFDTRNNARFRRLDWTLRGEPIHLFATADEDISAHDVTYS